MLKECLFSAVMIGATCSASIALAEPVKLATTLVQVTGNTERTSYDGVVEAIRQTVVAAQVAGAVVALDVKVGDVVRADQVLLRIDARAANQNAAASDAQVLVARSSLELASKELARQRSLYQKQYISQAAFERAEAQFRA
ncbi:MAG: biotin/lipoyl-binding protein, partial [Herbaspirillum sp.]